MYYKSSKLKNGWKLQFPAPFQSNLYCNINFLTMESSPETLSVCKGRLFKRDGKGKLTPVINVVSKITFILFFFSLIEGLIQLSMKIFEEHGNEIKELCERNSFYWGRVYISKFKYSPTFCCLLLTGIMKILHWAYAWKTANKARNIVNTLHTTLKKFNQSYNKFWSTSVILQS